jgi:hypothetical protein
MQGFERADRQLLDAAALAGHLVPENTMFAFLAAHRAEVFPDAGYADLFSPPGVGRPSLPATHRPTPKGWSRSPSTSRRNWCCSRVSCGTPTARLVTETIVCTSDPRGVRQEVQPVHRL